MKKIILTACGMLFAFSAQYAIATTDHASMSNESNPMTQEYIKAMDEMHKPMMQGIMSQDPDVAFVEGMIPHHQGAIDMAKIEIKYGKDPEIKALAENVIKAQEQEIAFMKEWLKKHKSN